MDGVLSWLAGGSVASQLVLGGLFAVSVAVVVMFFIAVLQGREVSLWPPKIGRREPLEKKPMPRRECGDTRPTSAATQNPRPSSSPSDTPPPIGNSRSSAREFVYPDAKAHPDITVPGLSIKLPELFCTSIFRHTAHSIIEKCTIHDVDYVLKRTLKELYDVDAMTTLMSEMSPKVAWHGFHVTIATPLALWVDNYIWELLPFYEGVTLDKLILNNRYHFSGALLSTIYENLRLALYSLHEIGILHRDVCPSNLLLSSRGDIILLDPSFASQANTQHVAVGSPSYAAPEQLMRKAVFQSDLFSVAATAVFLGTGRVPLTDDRAILQQRIEEIEFGSFRAPFYNAISSLFLSLLSTDLSNRPTKSHYASVQETTVVTAEYYDVLGIVDASPFGYFIMQREQFQRFATDGETKEYLRKAIASGAVQVPNVREDVDRFLAGDNAWLRRM